MRAAARWAGLAVASLMVLAAQAAAAQAPVPPDPAIVARGNAVYAGSCAGCHDNALTHAPGRAAIAGLTAESVLHVLTSGRMQRQAAGLSAVDKAAVA